MGLELASHQDSRLFRKGKDWERSRPRGTKHCERTSIDREQTPPFRPQLSHKRLKDQGTIMCIAFSQQIMNSPTGVRKIRFMENLDVSPLVAPLDMIESCEQVGDLWYNSYELNDFRMEVRKLCRELRAKNCHNKKIIVSASFHSPTRELEQRSSLERQRRRLLTAKYVVSKQHELDADKLAQAAQRITKWAAELAVKEACSSSCDEQQQHGVKRSSEDDVCSEQRRVRPCLVFTARVC